jgi:hypothetical protein
MYRPKNVPEVIAAKTAEFRSKLKCSHNESVDTYYTRFHELLDEINDSRKMISKNDAIRHFIFTLGTDFDSIQQNYRINNLPLSWQMDDWPSLLILCRDYFNSIHPNGVSTKRDGTSSDSGFASKQDQITHQKKVRGWFMEPTKFKREIDAEQRRHPGKCIYHLCDNHSTAHCNVKIECDKTISEKRSSATTASTSTSGHLRHIVEETFEDAVDDSPSDVASDDVSNDTNEASLHYFARVSNHYLCLVRNNVNLNQRHEMSYPIIADSGANFHMFSALEFFESITPMSGKVILGDGRTSLEIKGVGTIKLKFGNDCLLVPEVRYVPDLAESIYSLFLHIQSPGYALHSSFGAGMSIIFPTFTTKAIIGHHDIYLNATPANATPRSELLANLASSSSSMSNTTPFCRHVTRFQEEVASESKKVNDLL